MSGIEVVGILLGGFPLLISAAEHYKDGFEPLLKWKRFRKEFIAFIDGIEIEKLLYCQMLERFLISADVPHEELCMFMTDSNYRGSHGKRLMGIFQGRLGTSWEAFLSTLETMRQLMADLEDVLCLTDGKIDWADEGASRWDYQLKRLRLSFSKKGERILGSLENHNRKLRELLDSSDKLESLKITRKDTSWGDVFETIRKHASNLHTALKRSWNCNCNVSHQGDLRLQCRNSTSDESSTFHMVFDVPKSASSATVSRREVVIVKKQDNAIPSAPTPTFSIPKEVPPSSTNHLRRNFEQRSSSQLSVASNSILTASASASSITSSQSSFVDVFSRSTSSQSTITTESCASTSETVLTTSRSKNWLSRSRKPKKSVRMQLPCSTPQIELTATLQTNITAASIMATEHQIDAGASFTVAQPPIDDLCSKLRTSVGAGSLGHFLDEEQNIFELTCLREHDSTSGEGTLISLDSMLNESSNLRLSRSQRYKIAHVISSSILQLQETPWLVGNLDKRTIFFDRKGTDISFESPYLQHSFVSSNRPGGIPVSTATPAALRLAARNSLSTLGILLLELCFGQVIEKQECRKPHLGSDGNPTSATDYMTARDWAETVWEEDPLFEQIIKRCVFCIFEEKADWASKKFTQAVYCSVVEPLGKLTWT